MMPKITFDVVLFANQGDVERSRKAMLGMMHALMYVNITWLMKYPTPSIYDAGVRYVPERNKEEWRDIPTIRKFGYGDCEDLSCWRAAELNVMGIKARPYIKWRETGPKTSQFHATVRLPDGRIEDPSAALGMNGNPIIGRPVYVDPGPMPP